VKATNAINNWLREKEHHSNLLVPCKGDCETCRETKSKKLPFRRLTDRDTIPNHKVHVDYCGRLRVHGLSGETCFGVICDPATLLTYVQPAKSETEAGELLDTYIQKYGQPRRIRSDQHGAFTGNTKFSKICREKGIIQEFTLPYSSQQNGSAERAIGIIMEKGRSLLHQRNVPRCFWPQAVLTAAYIYNRTPKEKRGNKIPIESYSTGESIHPDKWRVFGCLCYAHKRLEARAFGTLDNTASKGIFLGYGENNAGYRVYLVDERKIIYSKDVTFEEGEDGSRYLSQEEWEEMDGNEEEGEENFEEYNDEGEHNSQNREEPMVWTDLSGDNHHSADGEQTTLEVRRSTRTRRPPGEFWRINATEEAKKTTDPKTYKGATEGNDREEWKEAIQEELDNMRRNETWEEVDRLPLGAKPVSTKWVFKTKLNANGEIERRKARLVARGFTQREGIDYTKTFAPVTRLSTVRMLAALSALKNYKLKQLDVPSSGHQRTNIH